MLKKSIKTRLIAVTLSTALLISVAVGIHAFLMTNELLHEKADDVMAARCEAEAAQLNDILDGIQRNVRLMAWYCLDRLENPLDLTQPDYLNAYIAGMQDMFAAVAQNTSGIVSYYVRFNPALTTPTAGFYFVSQIDAAGFEKVETTDLSLYAPEDIPHVGWYWEPLKQGQPLWMEPYINQRTGSEIVSYVIPLYQDNLFIGVVGMDIDCGYLMQETHAISLYENGYAYLSNASGTPYHDHYATIDHRYCIEAKALLSNGMFLTIHASYLDVIRESYPILVRSIAIFLVLMAIFAGIIFHTTNHIINPLKELTQAVRRMEDGQEGVRFPGVDRQDEIGTLAQAFSQMSASISHRMSSISDLAYRDSLTGVKSYTAYKDAAAHLEQRLAEAPAPFGLIMTDSNDLKRINDVHGHDVGNAYICHICRIICHIFKHSPVYRIGGDEFVVLLEGHDLSIHTELLATLDATFASTPFSLNGREIPCHIARGWAVFDAAQDKSFNDVFVRADERMYAHKRMLKEQQVS